jgi:hypothetical protein
VRIPLLLAVALSTCAPADRALISEVLYDAVGDDTGAEFVELFNPTAHPVPLAGVRLEAGDGAGPGRWTLRWTGRAGDTLAAGARFLIGGSLVAPAPDALVTLDLQNGPDAVRLVWPDGALDVLGWGALADSEYFCGVPAPDVASGDALARVPDDARRGSNLLDFREQPPTPGRANAAGRDLAVRARSVTLDPEQPAPGTPSRVGATFVNRGTLALAAGNVRGVFVLGAAADTIVAPAGLAPGDSVRLAATVSFATPGRTWAWARAALAGDERAENDADSLGARIGPGPLQVREIQFHPAAGEGEWVELECLDVAPCHVAEFTLSDRGVTRGVPDAVDLDVPPDSLVVLAEDRSALLAITGHLDSTRVVAVKPWAALNNTNDSTGVADAVVVRERDGTRSDRVDYSASGVPAGVPLEWSDGRWQPSGDPAGTPLRAPVPLAPLPSRFTLEPRRVPPGAPRVTLSWALPWPGARVAVEVYDLEGRRVARPILDLGVRGRGERTLVLGGLTPGLYLVVLRARDDASAATLTETRALRVEGVVP